MAKTCLLGLSLLAACGSDHAASSQPDAAAPEGPDAAIDAAASGDQTVTFTYTPSWSGVTSVDVLGGFGMSSDWSSPLVSLTASGDTWTGTVQLPPGQYLYILHVVGDADAKNPTTLERYAVDPAQSAFALCPSASPTYSSKDPNPCSQLTVPTNGAPTLFHVTGKVTVGGTATAGFLVVLERDEPQSHHYFVDRATTAADGTYDLQAAPGNYRLQIQNPQYELKSDSQIDPSKAKVLRRMLTASYALSADVSAPAVEMAFDYSAFAPTTGSGGALPTTFTFGKGTSTKLEVYGSGNEIGDPWYSSDATTSGSAQFQGTFNTPQKGSDAVVDGTQYSWGVEIAEPGASETFKLTGQSLVYPVTWTATGS
ncbi:MAG TPA: hypothetical protein VMJ10_36320 [Kofleriaceae bacterium]|nr:hypothetical protein [Kofleriaceae bacterium]